MIIQHGRRHLKLHKLSDGEGTPLLLLHQVGGSADDWRDRGPTWAGPVYALDFAGHGASEPLDGGGYYPEYHAAEADIAVGALGDRAVVAGMGLGAYAAFLLAGARPDRVPAALLWAGRGLAGSGAEPDFTRNSVESIEHWDARTAADARRYRAGTDPSVSACEHDLRPYEYVAEFATNAHALLIAPATLAAPAPEWLAHVQGAAAVRPVSDDLDAALGVLAEYAD